MSLKVAEIKLIQNAKVHSDIEKLTNKFNIELEELKSKIQVVDIEDRAILNVVSTLRDKKPEKYGHMPLSSIAIKMGILDFFYEEGEGRALHPGWNLETYSVRLKSKLDVHNVLAFYASLTNIDNPFGDYTISEIENEIAHLSNTVANTNEHGLWLVIDATSHKIKTINPYHARNIDSVERAIDDEMFSFNSIPVTDTSMSPEEWHRYISHGA